ncbi:TIGR03086 family metal-binding protein [Actinomadura latina]|uniref:TIGR03086 family protein n=1 Tax=Actinomadura latina TaxID=163603 RepID=A0A846YXX5_9ACTN|nr:TIGR03086 family metal-binding protein [Actinomadura latina]NKZ03602.1 TIGR03086 family protein [Actinomadura latina]
MTSSPVQDLATVLAVAGDLVAGVRPGQWDDPTPCTDWNVRQLVGHVVFGDRMFAAILRGEAPPPPSALGPQDTGVLGDDPVKAQRTAAQDLLTALSRPGVLEQIVQVPVGPVPGVAAAHIRAVEAVVHGWDLAQATGQEPRFPDDIVRQVLEFSRAKLADIPPGRTPFGPPQPAPADAPPIVELAALLGRPVGR